METRLFKIKPESNNKQITGQVIVFNQRSNLLYDKRVGYFYETIKPEAVTMELLNRCDIIMKYAGNDNFLPLARSKQGRGYLRYLVTKTGVSFTFPCQERSIDILELIKDGTLDSCAFSFQVAKDGEQWIRNSNEYPIREITKIDNINEFSITCNGTYPQTQLSARSIELCNNAETKRSLSKTSKLTPAQIAAIERELKKVKADIASINREIKAENLKELKDIDERIRIEKNKMNNKN